MTEKKIDCLGEACPIPIVKSEKAIAELEVGDLLIVEIDHSCAMKNVPDWARDNGHNVEVEEIDEGHWEIYIEKTN